MNHEEQHRQKPVRHRPARHAARGPLARRSGRRRRRPRGRRPATAYSTGPTSANTTPISSSQSRPRRSGVRSTHSTRVRPSAPRVLGPADRGAACPSSAVDLYAMRAARILHVPFQYKPLLRLLRADQPRLLIADDVGVGKTIEAGLILKELEAQRDVERVLVMCPRSLVHEVALPRCDASTRISRSSTGPLSGIASERPTSTAGRAKPHERSCRWS